MNRTESERTMPLAFGIFLLGFTFAMFLLQNLPFTFGDDLNNINLVKHTPWPVLLRALANPFTPAWYVHGIESLLTTRAFFSVIFKLLYDLFGYNENAFWAMKAGGFACTGALIFIFVATVTQKKWVGFMASLFYFTLPPVYRSISWISDIGILAEMFIALSFLLFLSVYFCEGETSPKRILLPVCLLIFSAYLGMKLRETARMIPFILLGFIILHQNRNLFKWFGGNAKNKILFLTSLILFLPVIPWIRPQADEFDTRSHAAVFQIDYRNFLFILAPLFKILFWILLFVGAIFLLFRVAKGWIKEENVLINHPPWSVFLLVILWAGFSTLAFALNFKVQDNLRYLMTPLIPLTILIFGLHGRVSSAFQKPVFQIIVNLLFTVVVIIGLERNWQEVRFARNYFNGVEIADYKLTQKLCENYYQDPDVSWQELDDFHRGKGRTIPESREIKIKAWDENAKVLLNPEHLGKVALKWGAAYILVFESLPDRAKDLLENPNLVLIYESTTSNGSLYNQVFHKKKKANRPIYLYKYTLNPSHLPLRALPP